MSRWTHRKSAGCDQRLAPAFCRNAAGFHAGAEAAVDRFPGTTRYFLAIAVELSLKAYLLHRGISDDWNRIHIRHDLNAALRCARRAGLVQTPCGLEQLAALLTPYYKAHRVAAMPEVGLDRKTWTAACEIVRGLIGAVQVEIGQGDANSLTVNGRSGR